MSSNNLNDSNKKSNDADLDSQFGFFANAGGFKAQIVVDDHSELNSDLANSLRSIGDELSSKSFNVKLAATRAQNPFLQIVPMPDLVVTLFLDANAPRDFQIPRGCQFVRFKSSGDFYLSLNGNAQVPTLGNNTDGNFNSSMYKPDDVFYFVNEIQSISCVTPNAGTIVTMQCFVQL